MILLTWTSSSIVPNPPSWEIKPREWQSSERRTRPSSLTSSCLVRLWTRRCRLYSDGLRWSKVIWLVSTGNLSIRRYSSSLGRFSKLNWIWKSQTCRQNWPRVSTEKWGVKSKQPTSDNSNCWKKRKTTFWGFSRRRSMSWTWRSKNVWFELYNNNVRTLPIK